jgi:hypothetical protein
VPCVPPCAAHCVRNVVRVVATSGASHVSDVTTVGITAPIDELEGC